jgi:hypothetical protein
MFEQQGEGVAGVAAGASVLLATPPGTEADWQRLVDAQIAAAPAEDLWDLEVLPPVEEPLLLPLPAPPDQLIARAEVEPITAGLASQLWEVDPARLGADARVGYAVVMDRVANAAHARRGLAAAALVEVCLDCPQVPAPMSATLQLSAALGLGRGAASELVATALTLADRLPLAQQLALAGGLTWRKATGLATATAGVSDDHAARVEQLALPKAWPLSPSRFDALVRALVDTIDPDGKADRRGEQRRMIRLVRHHYGDGMGELFAHLPSEQLDVIYLWADTWARARKTDGDPRSLDELRVACLHQAAVSGLVHGDPHHCTTHCHPPTPTTSPLTDPDDPDAWPEPPTDTDDPAPHDNDDGPDDDGGPGHGGSPNDDGGPGEASPDADDDDPGPDDGDPGPGDPGPGVGCGDASTGDGGGVESVWSLPRRHGRRVVLTVVWDLRSLLGLTGHCGLLLDSETGIAASVVREMITGGLRVRRAVIDTAGYLVDLTPKTWLLPPGTGCRGHRQPVELLLTTPRRLPDLPRAERDAFDELHGRDPLLADLLTDLLDYPLTADSLDTHPGDEKPSAALAAFVCLRAGHPVNPAAGPTAANAADLDHHLERHAGGPTVRANLGPLTRSWHRGKTFTNWTVHQHPDGWHWTSPTGRTYLVEPFDYRRGP